MIQDFLLRNGASFFPAIHQAVGDGYPGETIDALWDLVWQGIVSNDSFVSVRAFVDRSRSRRQPPAAPPFRSRQARPAGGPLGGRIPARAQGRWSLVESRLTAAGAISATDRANARARALLHRYGVLVREAPEAESVTGGFSAVYPLLKAMEESGRVRRGMFVAGLGATQFAEPAALELLRSLAREPESTEAVELAATDPANPWGALLKWPESGVALTRTAGASVILVNGSLAAYRRAGNTELQVFLPEAEPDHTRTADAVAACLTRRAQHEHALFARDREHGLERDHRRGLLIGRINGGNASAHPLARALEANGFVLGARGYHLPRRISATEEAVVI